MPGSHSLSNKVLIGIHWLEPRVEPHTGNVKTDLGNEYVCDTLEAKSGIFF